MADTLRDAVTRAAEFLRLEGKEAFETSLKGLANDALDAVKLYFQSRGVNALKQQQDTTLTAGDTFIDITTDPTIFSVLQTPIELFEKPAGTSYWINMKLVPTHLPYNIAQTDKLVWWAFEGGQIKFVGATVDVDVRVRYIGDPAALSLPTTEIDFPDLVSPLAHIIASRAQGGSDYHEQTAAKLLELISRTDGRIEQQRPGRRIRRIFGIPYRRY